MSPSRRMCRYLTSYLTGELDEPTLEAFERHVARCRACQVALAEISPAWEALIQAEPSEMDVKRAEGWRDEILGRIVGSRGAERHRRMRMASRERLYRAWAYAASAVAIAASAAFVAARTEAPAAYGPPANALAALSSTPIADVAMKPMNPGARGSLYVFRQGPSQQWVVVVEGLAPVSSPGAYSVWYVHGNVHELAATLKVDRDGVGIAVLPIPPREAEMVGITREPDAKDVRPRGKRVLIARLPRSAL
ncbi:anti-sigma factor [Alicyclobacillus sendaiensis]|uniref:anti-sigma factor n=1 Tax=Alicyclobacillus sendaiensis TaxID=192387 RepID=UPI0026F46EBB|nr:anti-sigma factor [Alicyclobacillus sendaiensis]